MDRNRHLLFMRRLLRDIYADPLLASELKFKGGTAAMFFYGLPRFSTDLDFNLTDSRNQKEIYQRLLDIVGRHGLVRDCANKTFGPVVVLDYGIGERNLKIEVSNRRYDNHYELHELSSLMVPVMSRPDMFTHKLCAMRERLASRDVFDVWYFLSRGWELNPFIIKERTGLDVPSFLGKCLVSLEDVSVSSIMMEIGELLDDSHKEKVHNGLIDECKSFLEDYKSIPVITDSVSVDHTQLLLKNDGLLKFFFKERIDPSTIPDCKLRKLLDGQDVVLRNKTGYDISVVLLKDGRIKKKNRQHL